MIKLKPIAESVIREAGETINLNTYGDLKSLLKALVANQKTGSIVSKGKEVAVDTVLSFIPGAGAAKSFFDLVKAAYKKPDTKKTNTWLDKLDIDDDVSAIVDDAVENGFIENLTKTIEAEPDDKELESDFNMNKKLQDYLSDTYNKRTVTYQLEP